MVNSGPPDAAGFDVSDFDADDVLSVAPELEGTLTDVTRRVMEARQDAMVEALMATDWDETPIVDIVMVRGFDPGAFDPDKPFELPPVRVARYERRAPPVDVYGPALDQRVEVTRVTRPLLERLRDDPDLEDDALGDVEAILAT